FESIARPGGGLPASPSLYIGKPSATDPGVAPPGDENLYVLVPVAADPGLGRGGVDGAGDPQVEAFVDCVIDRIAAWTGARDLADRIVVRRTVAPGDFAADLNAWSGSALGPSHSLRQSAFLRARNAPRGIDGLLYAGSSTIPGIGVPMCLISAELVLKRLRGDRSASPLPEPTQRTEAART
ncbi:MAG TPA: phytoene desaturase, partial [Microbacteriaceae bacterium]|nr:phytoene desaturase [Microbacteriaceae bacterium]